MDGRSANQAVGIGDCFFHLCNPVFSSEYVTISNSNNIIFLYSLCSCKPFELLQESWCIVESPLVPKLIPHSLYKRYSRADCRVGLIVPRVYSPTPPHQQHIRRQHNYRRFRAGQRVDWSLNQQVGSLSLSNVSMG